MATLLAVALVTAALARDRGPDSATDENINHSRESSSSEDDTSDMSNNNSNSDSDRFNLPDIARPRVILSAAQVQADLESRLHTYCQDQDKALLHFQASNHRQHRIISDRFTVELGCLNIMVDDLRRKLIEQQAALCEAQ